MSIAPDIIDTYTVKDYLEEHLIFFEELFPVGFDILI